MANIKAEEWLEKIACLSASERRHVLNDAGCYTEDAFQRTIDKHDEWRMANPGGIEPCWDCRRIAIKLNMQAKGCMI